MSDLRDQLHAMRHEYREPRYPGDLAAELLALPAAHNRMSIWRMAAIATAVGAMAAAVALWISLRPGDVAPPAPEYAMAAPIASPIDELPAIPAFPADLPALAPMVPDTIEIGSMPAWPAMDLTFTPTETPEES